MFQDRPGRGEIVLAGRSNAGKSTLMRELAGYSKFTTGKEPDVTRKPDHLDWNAGKLMFTDLPRFGFMSGVDHDTREAIKADVIQYIEEYTGDILTAVLIVDGKSVIDIINRHTIEDSIPHDVEMFFSLDELNIPTAVAINKIDKVDDHDERLNDLCGRFDLFPPWKQWRGIIAPITAKHGDVSHLEGALRSYLHEQGRDDLFKFL